MKTSVFLDTYVTALTALTLTLSVGCTNHGHSSSSPATAVGNGLGSNNGTTDGAGGNGINGKAYESYAVDPTSLPAYQKVLKPIFDNINKVTTDNDLKNGGNTSSTLATDIFWKFKSWYLAPVSLQSIDKATLGVAFTKENTQQLALQTDKEVWIDGNLFQQMDLDAQARLLLHEFFMTAYLTRFDSQADLCKKWMTLIPNGKFSVGGKDLDASICNDPENSGPAREPKRALTKEDYANVRSMTDYVIQSGSTASYGDFNARSLRFGFSDPSAPEEASVQAVPNTKSMQSTEGKVIDALKAIVVSKTMNVPCYGLSSKTSSQTCALGFKEYTLNDRPVLELTISDFSTGMVLQKAQIVEHSFDFVEGQIQWKVGGEDIYQSTLSGIDLSPLVENATYSEVDVFFNSYGDESLGQIVAVKITPRVVAAVSKTDSKSCTTKNIVTPVTKTLKDDVVLISTDPTLKLLNQLTSLSFETTLCDGSVSTTHN